jgi:prepilin-type N-terminal cleavage/methylation domain-containing protein
MKIKKGFSLLEVVISLAILVIGIVGVIRAIPIALRLSKRSEVYSKVAILAQEKMEEVKLAGYDKISQEPPLIEREGKEGNFNWEIQIEQVDLPDLEKPNNVRKIILTIEWLERQSKKSEDFVSYVAK